MHLPDREDRGGGSGKGPAGWFSLTDATVYLDHPQHAPAEHTLNIDFLNPAQGPSARVAVELTAESARALVRAIEAALDVRAARPGLSLRPPRSRHRPGGGIRKGRERRPPAISKLSVPHARIGI